MNRFDRFLTFALMGAIAPLALFLAFWWGSIPLVRAEGQIIFFALAGLAAGIVLDFTVLRRFVRSLFFLRAPALMCVGIFYSILVFGFFMGFPLFNSVVGIVFAYIAAKRCALKQLPRTAAQNSTKKFNLFFAAVLIALCTASAYLALREPDIASQIKSMIGLPFEVEMWMIWTLILVGGTLLVLFQIIASRLVSELVLKNSYERDGV